MITKLLIVLFIATLSITCFATTDDDSWETDESWIAFISQHRELYDKFYPVIRRMRKDYLTTSDIRRLEKRLEGHSYFDRSIVARIMDHVRKRYKFNDPIHGSPIQDHTNIEEVRVIGRMFDQFPMDPAEFAYHEITAMRGIRSNANMLYSKGKYDEAYPLLLALAKRGFKDSQSRLAYILFHGTENVAKSNLRALGWLGTAAHGESEPMFRVLFSKYLAEVPTSVRPTVDAVLAGYREQFDSSAYIDCTTNHKFNRGVVKRTYCQFDLEAQVEACKGLRCSAMGVNVSEDAAGGVSP